MRRLHDPAWLEAQYNNRARIVDSAQVLERRAVESARARERCDMHPDFRYGDGQGETLDVFVPRTALSSARSSAPVPAPVLFFVHGGWWRALDKGDHSFVAPPFVDRGALVVVPNYALCPAVSIETIAMQMARALAWTYRNATRFGGDPARIVVAGHCAGGHLAAMLLCCDWRLVGNGHALPARLVKSALAISGLFDLAPLRRTPYLQVDLRLTAAAVRRLSPVRFAPPVGRLYAVVGGAESEAFLRQNGLIRSAWGARAVPVCESVPGANHFEVQDALADPHGRVHALALQLLGLG